MTGVGEEVDLVAASVFETRNAVNGIRALRRINIRGDLLLDAGIHGVVHKVEVEGGGVGADGIPLHSEGARGVNLGALLGLGNLQSSNGDCKRQQRRSKDKAHFGECKRAE